MRNETVRQENILIHHTSARSARSNLVAEIIEEHRRALVRALPRVLALHCLIHATPVRRLRKWQIPQRVKHAGHDHVFGVVDDGAPDWAAHPAVELGARKSCFDGPPHAALRAGSAKQRLGVLVQVNTAALHAGADEGVAVGVARLGVDKTCMAITHRHQHHHHHRRQPSPPPPPPTTPPPPPPPPPPTTTTTTTRMHPRKDAERTSRRNATCA